jgi:hypothetical protein
MVIDPFLRELAPAAMPGAVWTADELLMPTRWQHAVTRLCNRTLHRTGQRLKSYFKNK